MWRDRLLGFFCRKKNGEGNFLGCWIFTIPIKCGYGAPTNGRKLMGNWDYKPDKSGVIPPGKGDGRTPRPYLPVTGTPKSRASGDVQGGSNTDPHRVYRNIIILSFQSEKNQHVDPRVYVQVPWFLLNRLLLHPLHGCESRWCNSQKMDLGCLGY